MARAHHDATILHSSDLSLRASLEHGLSPDDLAYFGGIKRRRRLFRDRHYRAYKAEVHAALGGYEWDMEIPRPAEGAVAFRAVAWNIERGKRFEALRAAMTRLPELTGADLFLLTEVDKGMGRSANRAVAQELAAATGMGYVFVNHHLVLCKGDRGEQAHEAPNRWGMHGSALLTRFPVLRFSSVPLPEYVDKFHVFEKRLGCKRALLVEVLLPDGPLTVVVAHLDPFAPPRHRVYQMRLILEGAIAFGGTRVLLGGDLNTNTYDVSKGPTLLAGILFKLTRLGVEGAIEHYLEPHRRYERKLFELMRESGLAVDTFNGPPAGTLHYDAHDPEVVEKARAYMPMAVIDRLQRMLEPWDGVMPMRVDWWAGHGLHPRGAEVIKPPGWRETTISDHCPIAVDVLPGEGEGLTPPRRRPLRRARPPRKVRRVPQQGRDLGRDLG